ncbi:MAG TPA: SDR family oxidoreductase, partial [Tissierellia bacterium]|nr:SDR family oxidoreductase [Tissierellia bacterium]
MNFQDKHVLVTGASSGIGRETALQFAKAGASVIAVARRKERLDELAAEAETTSGKIIPLQADLMQKEGPEKMMQEVFEIFDGLDILVNNAGIMDDMSG